MTDYGKLLDANTLQIERLLPGPIERVWAYLTEAQKRAKWLAGGEMEPKAGGKLELVWRNNELTPHDDDIAPPTDETGCTDGEFRMQTHVLIYEPYNKLSYAWEEGTEEESEVTFDLVSVDDKVRLTLTHRRLVGSERILGVSSGWHAHIDILEEVLSEKVPGPYWANYQRLQDVYTARHQLS